MRKLATNAPTLGSSATWSDRASGTDGRDVSTGEEGSPGGRSIPQEIAPGLFADAAREQTRSPKVAGKREPDVTS